METELREMVKKQLHLSLAENIINNITGEILYTGINELDLYGNKMPGTSPLGFIEKNIDIIDNVYDSLYFKQNELEDSYINAITKMYPIIKQSFPAGNDIIFDFDEDLDFELNSTAENIINEYKKYFNMSILKEDRTTDKEISEVLNKNIDRTLKVLVKNIDMLEHIKKHQLEQTNMEKYLTGNEKKVLLKLINSLEESIQYIKYFKNFIEKLDTKILFDMDNKRVFIEKFRSTGVAIVTSLFLLLNSRILFGNVALTYGSKSVIDSLFGNEIDKNLNKYVDILNSSFKIVNKEIFEAVFGSKFVSDLQFICQMSSDINPRYLPILNLLLGNQTREFDNSVARLIAKQSSLSAKYLHHIDELFNSLYNSLVYFNSILSILDTVPLKDVINSAKLEGLLKNIKSFIYATNTLDMDITALTIGGANVIHKIFNEEPYV